MSVAVQGSALRRFYDRHRSWLRRWLDAPPYYRASPTLNRAGLQVFRVTANRLRHVLRPARRHSGLEQLENQLDIDGIVVIPNFLPADVFSEVERAYDQFGTSDQVNCALNKGDTGVDWYTGKIRVGASATEAERVLTKHIADNPTIHALAEHVLRRKVPTAPTLAYQRLVVRVGMADDRDVECVLHADRHFACVKMAFYLAENRVENGAYVFCPGSHRLTQARLAHEYEYSVREAHFLSGSRQVIPQSLLERGRNRVTERARAAMQLREVDVVGQKNTLVVSNNAGFHKRGIISPGQERRQIRILFYYVQRPWYTRLFMALQ